MSRLNLIKSIFIKTDFNINIHTQIHINIELNNIQMQEESPRNLRELNKEPPIEIEHNLTQQQQTFQRKPKKHSCDDHSHSHSHDQKNKQKNIKQEKSHQHDEDNDDHHGHSHGNHGKKHKHQHKPGQKNYAIMIYTIFTCFSCWYLETQHLNPFKGDHLSKLLSYIAYFDVFMCLWSYIQTYRIKSTVKKLSKLPTLQLVDGKVHDPMYDLTVRPCQKCNFYKLPRVSHCSSCGQCIYKLDHHCMWTQTCIGHCNQRPFYLFCLYMCIGVIQFWVSTYRAGAVMYGSCNFFGIFEPGVYILWIITCMSAFFVGMMIVGLFISHSMMVMTNYTTLDSMKKKKMCPIPICQCRKSITNDHNINPFDRGQIQNLRSLFGTNILTCWLPFGRQIQNEFIIQPMNPHPTKLQLMQYTQLHKEEQIFQAEIQRLIPQLKQIYKGKKILNQGQEIQV